VPGGVWVYGTIAAAALANVIMSAVLGVPIRIILASFLAIMLAETADTEVYQKLIRYPWLLRVAGSNAVSVPLDTLLFTLVAFAGSLVHPRNHLAAVRRNFPQICDWCHGRALERRQIHLAGILTSKTTNLVPRLCLSI
jgi:uncharacterized PurR-regulated membrane protein YhhQ (DUF165 family)